MVGIKKEHNAFIFRSVSQELIDLPGQGTLILQARQFIGIFLFIYLFGKDKFSDTYGIGNDIKYASYDRERDNIHEIKYPDIMRFNAVHPHEENSRCNEQLYGHEERFVYHEHRRDQQKNDKRYRIGFGFVLRDKTAKKEKNRNGKIYHQLSYDRILLQIEEKKDRNAGIEKGKQIKQPVAFHRTEDRRNNKQDAECRKHEKMQNLPYFEIRDVCVFFQRIILILLDSAV